VDASRQGSTAPTRRPPPPRPQTYEQLLTDARADVGADL
jgi:hypothetical protein